MPGDPRQSDSHPLAPPLPAAIANSVLDLIGNTPMVRLAKVVAGIGCSVVAKLETANPGGSIKDRPALAMLNAAEKAGLLEPGGTIIEPTSGNTGVGLAVVAAQRGYRCVFVTTDKVAPEKLDLLRAYNAEVVVCPVAVEPDDPRSYYSTAKRLLAETPGAFGPSQYENPLNPQAHYDTTGPEIWRQTEGRITHFVAGAGTGGTISGVGRYLKEQNPDVQVVVADPDASVYSGGDGRPYLVEGIGEDFWPATYDSSVVDRVVPVTDAQSFEMARRVTRTEGLLIGGSGGTAVYGALEVARELTPKHLVVTLIPDSGRGYLSRVFDNDWMATMGFAISSGGSQSGGSPEGSQSEGLLFHYVRPTDTVIQALAKMSEHGLDEIPVAKGDMPVAAAEIVGSVSATCLAQAGSSAVGESSQSPSSDPVSKFLQPALPQLGICEPAGHALSRMDSAHTNTFVLFVNGRPVATFNRAAVLDRASVLNRAAKFTSTYGCAVGHDRAATSSTNPTNSTNEGAPQ